MKRLIIFLSLLAFTYSYAQVNIGGSVQSQSVIKGTQLCKTPVFGGYLEYVYRTTTVTVVITSDFNGNYAENLLIIKHIQGPVWAAVTDYYYPYSSDRWSNFSGANAGSHYIETSVGGSYKGFEFLLSSNIYNDTTYSPYVQFCYNTAINDGLFGVFAGFVFGQTFFYDTFEGGPHAVYTGFKYTRKNVTLTWYVNPTKDVNGIIIAYDF
jgi:hypothetical protein